jgi:hypothetical protein
MPEDTRPVAAASHSDANWAMAVDLDLQTVLILAKASTQALLNLSPLAYREITSAIAEEVKILREQGDARSLATARAVEQYLPRAA